MDRVKDKVAIITGAATGLGEADALLLAKEGAKVVVADIDEIKGNKVAEEIVREEGESIFVKHDVTSEKDWNNVIEKTLVVSYNDGSFSFDRSLLTPFATILMHQCQALNLFHLGLQALAAILPTGKFHSFSFHHRKILHLLLCLKTFGQVQLFSFFLL